MRTLLRITAIGCLFVMLFNFAAQAQVKIGILPRLSTSELLKMFTPLANQLEKQIGQKVELVIPKDFATYYEMLKKGQFDYCYSNPNVYIMARSELGSGVEPMVIAVESGTGKTFTGCFLVKKGSPIKKISDIKGKKILFVDEKSAGAYMSQLYTLKKSGMTKKDFSILPFAKKHTNVAIAIQNGAADVGGIRTADFKKIQSDVNIPDVVILSESEAIPNWPFYSLPHSKKETTAKVKKALLEISQNAALRGVLKDANLDGLVTATDADFNVMRKVSDAVKAF